MKKKFNMRSIKFKSTISWFMCIILLGLLVLYILAAVFDWYGAIILFFYELYGVEDYASLLFGRMILAIVSCVLAYAAPVLMGFGAIYIVEKVNK